MQLSEALRKIGERASFATEEEQRAALDAIDRCADKLDGLGPDDDTDDDDQGDDPDASDDNGDGSAPAKKTTPAKKAGARR